jgi:hypothetical protein
MRSSVPNLLTTIYHLCHLHEQHDLVYPMYHDAIPNTKYRSIHDSNSKSSNDDDAMTTTTMLTRRQGRALDTNLFHLELHLT